MAQWLPLPWLPRRFLYQVEYLVSQGFYVFLDWHPTSTNTLYPELQVRGRGGVDGWGGGRWVEGGLCWACNTSALLRPAQQQPSPSPAGSS
jgi:hypothetical protein